MHEGARINLVKLCVGANTVDDLIAWQKTRRSRGPDGERRHVTRMWPKREAELLNGGSLYWVFRGQILCRQRILRLEEVIRHDGVRMCAIVLDTDIAHTAAAPKRPFQGWRYLKLDETPPDLPAVRENDDPIPMELNQALADIGVL